ncbi:alpha/beta hydrolase [Kocuria sp. TGY1127_2]|uniref:alpha/beta hydrolase n=1 Tax=Kocuria sp. TGY1127_2 TaxID=2711328 RepID=UPI0015BB2EAC|nr:alpha/beta hydrolase [Kocuria sp. TGY1127_2]
MLGGFYAEPGDANRSFDLYPPAGPVVGPAPLLIHLHGGAWRFGDKSSLLYSDNGQHHWRERLQAAGFAVASINYRLSHRSFFPAQLNDAKTAVRFFRSQANEFDIDPTRIAVSGASAGGHLAQLLAATPDSGIPYLEGQGGLSESTDVTCAVSFYGVSDLRSIFDDRMLCGFPADHPDDDGAERRLLGSSYPATPGSPAEAAWARAHPIDYARSDDLSPNHRPVFYVHGDSDSCVPWKQSGDAHRALRGRGISTALEIVPKAEHSDALIFRDEARIERIIGWIRAHWVTPRD